ncbi:MAG: acetylornithine deacetylase [Rhodobacteraceae bacterium]|nr:acetylornithine deacetylase [Paracoccaceae bacterium]
MGALEDTKTLLGELIGFPTVSADSNLDMIRHIANRLSECGAKVEIWMDDTGAKANLFATLGPERDGGIVLSGHSDVVPAADQAWNSDPFVMVERDGRWYGRGSCDMKGFVAAAVAMAPRFARLDLVHPVHFAITHDEETGCRGARDLAASLREKRIKPAMAIIGEPTMMQIIEGHKGCYEYTTRFTGFEGHSSRPDLGVNAVEHAVRFVHKLLELKGNLKTRSAPSSRFNPPWTTINTGVLQGGSAHNMIPGKATVKWEMRPVNKSDAAFVKEQLHRFCTQELMPAMRAVHPGAKIETEVVGEVEALEPTDENEARDLLMELTGADQAGVVSFGTEAGIFQGLGLSVVVCGPGSINQAHKPDEFIAVDQVAQCLDMLDRLPTKLLQE